MNYAVMGPLQPATRYFYRYGDEVLGRSPERSFVTGPALGAASSISVLVTADMVRLLQSSPFKAQGLLNDLWSEMASCRGLALQGNGLPALDLSNGSS